MLQFFKYILKDDDENYKIAYMTRDELKNKEVMVEEFVKLFKSKDYEEKILSAMNCEIR